jgi:putative transcriptional regulator
MPIIYNKLFYQLVDLKMKKKDLQEKAGITASIMARLAKNETVRTDTIEKICKALQCQPGDIMEYIEIPDEEINSPLKKQMQLLKDMQEGETGKLEGLKGSLKNGLNTFK